VWPSAKRDEWISIARSAFNLMYERPPEEAPLTLTLTPSGAEGRHE
jgi:hypothetical protein